MNRKITLDCHTLPAVSEVCTPCKHFDDGDPLARRCAAFPGGIPLPIWTGEDDHRSSYPGDNGIRFEPLPAAKPAAA